MKKILSTVVLCFITLLAFASNEHKDIDSLLNSHYQNGTLNGNVLILKNGKTIYEKSFGYTDSTKKTMLTSDYRFNIGSVYKEFPAVAIMQLKEKNLLQIDDKISTYLSGLPKWAETVSIKHLLQYSGGLPKINWGAYFSKNLAIHEQDIMNDLTKIDTLAFAPGSDYLYTNYSPILLIKIIEKITNQPFKKYAQEHLFAPNQLAGTVIKQQYPYQDRSLMAIPFDKEFKEDNYKVNVPSVLFNATARDLSNWLQRLHNLKIISKTSLQFLSEVAKTGEHHIQAPLGSCQWKNNTVIEHSHHGSSGNYECIVRNFKQDKITIVILTNQKNKNVGDISEALYAMTKDM